MVKSFAQFVESFDWGKSQWRPTRVPLSSHYGYEKRLSLAKKWLDGNKREIDVPHDKLRATQSWVHKKYRKGSWPTPVSPASGVMDKEGIVHLIDGHHRADHAFNKKEHLKVSVVSEAVKLSLSPMSTTIIRHGSSSAKLVDTGSKVTVTGVSTPVSDRGKGQAHALMKRVTDHLDSIKKPGRLVALATDDGVDPARLKTLYSRHGFVTTKNPGEMVREPRG